MLRRLFIGLGLSCVAINPAHGIMLMEDELLPKPQFSERSLSRGPTSLTARLLTSVGQDVVETPVNGQTEKRLFAALGIAARGGLPLSEKIRFDASVTAIRSTASTLVEENSGWKKTESQSEVTAQAHGRALFNEGLRAGAGACWVMRPAAQQTFEFAGQSAMTKFDRFSFWTPEFSVSKEASGWSAGLGWRPRVTQSRRFVREASDETSELTEDVLLDELWSAGVLTQLANNRSLRIDVNLHGSNTSQTRQDSNANSSTSAATSEDNSLRRYEVSFVFGLGELGGHRLSFGAGYQSIGYSDQSHVTPQSIPLWSLVVRDEFKQSDVNVFVDGLFGYGSDLQSLPDLNAKYKRLMMSVQTGVQF